MAKVKSIKKAGNGVSLNPWINDRLDIICFLPATIFVFLSIGIFFYYLFKSKGFF